MPESYVPGLGVVISVGFFFFISKSHFLMIAAGSPTRDVAPPISNGERNLPGGYMELKSDLQEYTGRNLGRDE